MRETPAIFSPEALRRRASLTARPAAVQWAVIIIISAVFVGALEALRLPAALLLGPMGAAIVTAANGMTLRMPRPAFLCAQGVIGVMIARSFSPSIGGAILARWPLFVMTVLAVIALSGLLGWLLARWRVLPGSAAVWGSSPGAATAMTLMAGAYGADARLVAFMQFLRVVFVTLAASLVARLFAVATGAPRPSLDWFPALSWPSFIATLALAGLGAWAGRASRIPAGTLLLPLTLGAVLHGVGAMQFDLPPWLLALSYAVVGWQIGLGFTPAILAHASRAFPKVAASILAQILLCGALAFLLTRFAGVDALTAYLATSPGGADSVAIIAASARVDMPFVMALQTFRLILVILISPGLCRFIVRHIARSGGEA
ncbi:AbrB family transcriptional regulator [Methylocella tundrae]|uniref:Putative regulator AbrB n=1 Tax=Methylocella tundrae TaxID=227605 RepID=A0A4U8Z1E9_METTU|nr:AbrB family transcriptional regulator [Methylocella tundrae]WPP03169.1 AbrB family transcriptional regulator [Methylocella tundrae]VFU09156.1 putative regulator AbrB [Methylocella tundrae]